MPYSPPKPCRHAGCPNLSRERWCPLHTPQEKSGNRESAHKRGYGKKWQTLRRQFLLTHPLCVECQRAGRLTPAEVVDHIVPHRGDPVKMWSEANWQSLCKPCHDRKTGAQDSRPVYDYQNMGKSGG